MFGAGLFLINACENVSKAYDCVQELLRQCQDFTQRLEIYVKPEKPEINGNFLKKVIAILSFTLEVFGQCFEVFKSSRWKTGWGGIFRDKNQILRDSVAKLNIEFKSEEQFNIALTLSEVKKMGLTISETNDHQRQAKLQAAINSIPLGPIDIATRQDAECRKSSESPPELIYEDKTYQLWLDGPTEADRWLWGFGTPGAGKTSLVSYLTKAWQSRTELSKSAGKITHYVNGEDGEVRQQSIQKSAVALFYCSYRFKEEQRPDAVFQSLVGQLLRQLRESNRDGAEKRVEQIEKLNSDGANAALNWTVILDNVISEFQQTFIVVDALDENESGYGELILRLSRLKSKSLKLFVTSRDDELPFRADARRYKARPLTIRAKKEFIEAYVDARFLRIQGCDEAFEFIGSSALPDVLSKLNPDQKREITKNIVNAADGNFYCAELQITTLKAEGSKEDVQSKLKDLPKQSLQGVIQEAIDRISKQSDRDRREIGRQTLMWATYAGRTLTIEEIQHAIALTIRPYALEDPKSHQIEVERLSQSRLVESSRYFLRVDGQTSAVQVHKAIKDYCDYANVFEDAHLQMAESCLAFLGQRSFDLRCSSKEEYDARKQENPFYEYAARHWGFHMKRAGERKFLGPTSPVSMATLLNRRLFVNSVAVALHEDLQNLRMWNWYDDTWKGLSDPACPVLWPIHLLTYFDLQQTADWWLQQNSAEVDRGSRTGTTPLYLACSMGRVRIVEILLFDHGANPAQKGARPSGYNLAAAVMAQSPAIVERLLYISAKELLPQTNVHGRCALGEAALHENEDIVRMIANAISTMPNEKDLITHREWNDDWNALHEAAHAPRPSPSVLELLVNAKGGKELLQQKTKKWGDTPLHIAAGRGLTVAVKTLLALGADPMDRQVQGKTPLHIACEGLFMNNEETIKILLEKTDHLAKDNDGFTTWHLAAMHGRPKNLGLLIQKTPKMLFNVKNKNQTIPIRTAAYRRNNDWVACIDVLLELCPGEIVTEDAYVILDTLIHRHGEVGLRALRRLLEHPVEPWPLHKGKTTVLHRIVHHSTLEGVKTAWELLGSKEVLEYRDAGGSTALVLASHLCGPEKAEFLINVGADVNAQDDTGRTALHYAIERDMPDLAGKLLEKHADYHIKDNDGVEALDRASAQSSCGKIWQVRNAKFYGSDHS